MEPNLIILDRHMAQHDADDALTEAALAIMEKALTSHESGRTLFGDADEVAELEAGVEAGVAAEWAISEACEPEDDGI